MKNLTALGALATILTVLNLVPQMVKVFRTKSTKDLSLLTFVLISISATTWVIYGIANKDLAVTTSNIIVLAFALTILIKKRKHG